MIGTEEEHNCTGVRPVERISSSRQDLFGKSCLPSMQAHYKWNHSPSCGKAGHLYLKNERASSDCPHHLGKMVEKVAAMMVSAHCEVSGFHPGQHRFREGRSARTQSE